MSYDSDLNEGVRPDSSVAVAAAVIFFLAFAAMICFSLVVFEQLQHARECYKLAVESASRSGLSALDSLDREKKLHQFKQRDRIVAKLVGQWQLLGHMYCGRVADPQLTTRYINKWLCFTVRKKRLREEVVKEELRQSLAHSL